MVFSPPLPTKSLFHVFIFLVGLGEQDVRGFIKKLQVVTRSKLFESTILGKRKQKLLIKSEKVSKFCENDAVNSFKMAAMHIKSEHGEKT